MFGLVSWKTLSKEKDEKIALLQDEVNYLRSILSTYLNPIIPSQKIEEGHILDGAGHSRMPTKEELEQLEYEKREAEMMLMGEFIEVN